MTITITAFERSPDGGKGLARDTRVRWALEEAGLPYEVRLVSFTGMKEPAHLAVHPFGQIPTYEEGDLALFETGAIIFHIADRHTGLLPEDPDARARAITWARIGRSPSRRRHLSPPPMRRAKPPASSTPTTAPDLASPFAIGCRRSLPADTWPKRADLTMPA